MSEAIIKALKWYLLSLAVIIGSSAFLIANRTGEVLPWMVVVLGFGAVYIMSVFWSDFRGKILFFGAVAFAISTAASIYAAEFLFVFLNINMLSYSAYFMWGLTVGVLGIPIMCIVFYFVNE